METYFDQQVKKLYEEANKIITAFLKADPYDENSKIEIPEAFKEGFFSLISQVNLSLMEDQDNFYGYFLFQMSREIRFDISSPTAVNFKGAQYVICFNPIIFLTLNIKQMESTIKHEILHILSMHLIRAKELKGRYTALALNMAMDVVVNKYLDHLPPYATTLERVNLHYSLQMPPYEPFEYYAEKLQTAIDLLDEEEDSQEDDSSKEEKAETEYSPEKTHDIWEESNEIEDGLLTAFTEKLIHRAQKGKSPDYLESIIASFKNHQGELPWNVYLNRLMGYVASNKKKTVTRRNRRQPERLDLRGEIRNYKAKILIALDISGSISDEEFIQGMKEVLNIVKNYHHEITLLECDNEIRREYQVQTAKDIKDRINKSGGTQFTPVFEYANHHQVDLLVYFTDGKGENRLQAVPRGYKVLWVISGKGDWLSLENPYGAVKRLSKMEMKADALVMKDVIRDGYSMQNQERMI